jgi:hypothetical protein
MMTGGPLEWVEVVVRALTGSETQEVLRYTPPGTRFWSCMLGKALPLGG